MLSQLSLKAPSLYTAANDDVFWMNRCLTLAINGLGNVAPNPLVGCVIVHKNKIIGEGYHSEFGHHHAEVNAINSVADKKLLRESTLYVNLEPCSHHGKTPPCCDLIAHYQFKKVVIGALDSNKIVDGSGVKNLNQAGIEVVTGVLEKECIELNKRFYTFHEKKRPFYVLKWAETSDGFIFKQGEASQISNPLSTQKVHQIRAEEQAILVGKETLLVDNPSLTVRHVQGKNPLRIIVSGEIPNNIQDLNIFRDKLPTLFFNTSKSVIKDNVEFVLYKKGEFFTSLNKVLFDRNIASVLVEGGAATLASFINENNWDLAFKIVSGKRFDGGKLAPSIDLKPSKEFIVGKNEDQDLWQVYQNDFAK